MVYTTRSPYVPLKLFILLSINKIENTKLKIAIYHELYGTQQRNIKNACVIITCSIREYS